MPQEYSKGEEDGKKNDNGLVCKRNFVKTKRQGQLRRTQKKYLLRGLLSTHRNKRKFSYKKKHTLRRGLSHESILKMTESKEKEIIEEEEIIYSCSLLEKRKIEAVKVAS